MIAVILSPGPSPTMHGLDAEQSLSLLPLVDRPILQHIIESLASQGITSIELITGHAPEKVEALLGNGDRWGCSFRYHLATQPDRPYRSLKVIARAKTEPWVLIHADRYPCLTFPAESISNPTLYYLDPKDHSGEASRPCANNCIENWGGTAVFPAGFLSDEAVEQTPEELRNSLQHSVSSRQSNVIATPEWIDFTTPAALLDTQARLLGGKLNGLMISGIERQPGVWLSRNVEVHPTVRLTAPLYIGPNCRINRDVRLGPNVVISGSCLVDSNTHMENSLAMSGSYIGERLELSEALVQHNLLVNVRLGTSVSIAESFLLGGLEQKTHQSWAGRAAQSILAALLIVIFFPITILSLLYFALTRRVTYVSIPMAAPAERTAISNPTYSLAALGRDAWSVRRPAGWSAFVRQFLPGLFAVVMGRLSLVGLPPLQVEQMAHLPQEWRALHLNCRAGLITEAAVAATDVGDETQLYLADAYYAAKRSWLHDVQLALKYLLRLIVPANRPRS
jgi:NDP-sugar pyrophosphorylase family protein